MQRVLQAWALLALLFVFIVNVYIIEIALNATEI